MDTTMKALTFSKFGEASVLEYKAVPIPALNEGEVLVEMKAIGLNYADIYRRKGNYHLKGAPPYIAGYEGSGIVSVSNTAAYKIGDRVAFADVPFANAAYVAVPEAHLIPLPEAIDFATAAAVLLQGLTAHYLSEDSHKVQDGETVLIHAASGGVGQLLIQMCKNKGAIVIGLSRDKTKFDTILRNGADYAVALQGDWKAETMKITNGKGVTVAYDSVGSTLMDSFEVTRDCGHVVFYGMSGGDPQAIDPRMLMDTSKTLTGGDLWSYLTTQDERINRAAQLFDWIRNGQLLLTPPVTFALSEGQKAHEYLESGKSSSKILLLPD